MGGGVPRTAQFQAPEHPHPTGRLQLRDVPEVRKPHSQVPQRPQSAGSPEGPCPAPWPPSLLAPPCTAPHGSPSSPVHHKSRAGPCSLCAPRRAQTARLTDAPKATRDLPSCRLHKPKEQTAVAGNQHPADPKVRSCPGSQTLGGVPHAHTQGRHRTAPPAVTTTTGVHSSAISLLQHSGCETQKVWRTLQNNTDLDLYSKAPRPRPGNRSQTRGTDAVSPLLPKPDPSPWKRTSSHCTGRVHRAQQPDTV